MCGLLLFITEINPNHFDIWIQRFCSAALVCLLKICKSILIHIFIRWPNAIGAFLSVISSFNLNQFKCISDMQQLQHKERWIGSSSFGTGDKISTNFVTEINHQIQCTIAPSSKCNYNTWRIKTFGGWKTIWFPRTKCPNWNQLVHSHYVQMKSVSINFHSLHITHLFFLCKWTPPAGRMILFFCLLYNSTGIHSCIKQS